MPARCRSNPGGRQLALGLCTRERQARAGFAAPGAASRVEPARLQWWLSIFQSIDERYPLGFQIAKQYTPMPCTSLFRGGRKWLQPIRNLSLTKLKELRRILLYQAMIS